MSYTTGPACELRKEVLHLRAQDTEQLEREAHFDHEPTS